MNSLNCAANIAENKAKPIYRFAIIFWFAIVLIKKN